MSEIDDLIVDDDDEIFTEQWTRQITDQPADFERRRGSVHRGGAYLQDINYPPHGASSGQEGGLMRPEEEIEVLGADIEVLGEDYARGLDILGAAAKPIGKAVTVKTQTGTKVSVPQRAGFVQRSTPGGRKITSLVVKKPKSGDDKTSIKNAKDAGTRAVSSAKKMKDHIAKAAKTTVHGDVYALGAAAPAKKGAKVAVKGPSKVVLTKMSQLVDKLADKGKKTLAAADKHEKLVNTQKTKLKAGVKSVSAKMDPMKSTSIKGDEYDMIAGEADVLLDAIGASLPNPSNPGYLMDGTPDPAYWGGASGALPGYTGAMDPSDPYGTGAYTDPGATDVPALPGPPDYGLGPAPQGAPPLQAGIDFVPDPGYENDFNVYSSTGEPGSVPLPEGAVIYDGTQAFPQKGVGSYTYFHQAIPGGKKPDGGNGSGYVWHNNHWRNWWANAYHDNVAVDTRWHGLNPQEAASLPVMAKNSEMHSWGPLIGNPTAGWTAGLRYDQGGDQWFWYYDKAPNWATAADKMKRDNQALLDYQALFTAAQTDYTAQQLQDQLDAQSAREQAKAQAAEDAAMARQFQQEQAAAAHQAELQAVADQQAAQQQANADDAAYRQSQIQWEQQARQQQADTESYQSQMMAQAAIDRQAMETQARIEQQAQETAAKIAMMQAQAAAASGQPVDDGSYAADDGAYADDGSGEYADEDSSMDSFEDAKYALDNEDVMGHGLRASDRHQLKREMRRRG